MKKKICLALLAMLLLFINSCHDEEETNSDLTLKSGKLKKDVVTEMKSWFDSNPNLNKFALLEYTDEIKWASAQVMEIDNYIVAEVQVKLKRNLKITGENDPSYNVDQRLLFIKENGNIKSYMEYFASKRELSYVQDIEKVNYSKKGKDFDGKIVLENPKREIKVISGLNSVDECGELKLKSATTICMCLVECFSDGTIRIISVLWCWDPADGGTGSGGSSTPPTSTTTPCNCAETCPICGRCLTLLKSAPVDNGDGGTAPTTGTSSCEMCAGHPVPNIDIDGYGNLNSLERELVKEFPLQAIEIANNRQRATDMTVTLFGHNGRNDCSDAFRHAYFQALNANSVGSYVTKRFSDAHEYDTPVNLELEKNMDLSNNAMGIYLGENCNGCDLVNKVMDSLRSGSLLFLSPINYSDPNFQNTGGITSNTALISTNNCF